MARHMQHEIQLYALALKHTSWAVLVESQTFKHSYTYAMYGQGSTLANAHSVTYIHSTVAGSMI